jgi:hypothetical protein
MGGDGTDTSLDGPTSRRLAGNLHVEAHAGAQLHHQLQPPAFTVPIRCIRSLATLALLPSQSPPLLPSLDAQPHPAQPRLTALGIHRQQLMQHEHSRAASETCDVVEKPTVKAI